ncbi:hypothetical protein DIPPA_17788 [Diplonema papillatum]|nr:hypothetical protein DIPPA_17788 [Diplonema papillatum]
MTTLDTSYLKDDLGPVLAKGIAETVVAAPQDPIEFLGLWLQHHLDEKEAEAKQLEQDELLKPLREEWNKAQAQKEKAATEVIQREWKSHVDNVTARGERETELRTRLEAFGDRLDEEGEYDPESIGYEACADQEAKEEDKERELDMLKTEKLFQRWKQYIQQLTKENVADVKARSGVSPEVAKVVRCAFYLIGKLPQTRANGEKVNATPSKLASWVQIRANIKPHPFLEQLKGLDPLAVPKRQVVRVRRILNTQQGGEDALKESGGQAVYIIAQWLWAAVEWRSQRDDLFRSKKEAGKDLPGMDSWEDDPGEEAEGEEQDADEMAEKEAEDQARREMEEEVKEDEEAPAE